MTKLYLIRHAEAEGNLYRIAQGQYNSILTDRGIRQVEALRQRFSEIQIDAVYASDLYRACATAGAVYLPKGLPLNRRRDLREICVGVWEQRTWGDIAREDAEQMENFNRRPHLWRVEGAEAPAQVLERVLAAVREIAAANQGRSVAIVSHGYAIRLLLAKLQGYSLEELADTPVGDNTAVSLVEEEHGELRVVFRDDSSHLRTPVFLAGERPGKRASGLEPGLYFLPLRLPEQAEFLRRCAAGIWAESGEQRTFSGQTLLAGAGERLTLVGDLEEVPVGLVQLGPETGWISLAGIGREYRKRGFGVQLIGQAVQKTRERGGQALRIALMEGCGGVRFFRDHGFRPAGTGDGGRVILEKNIGYDPAFSG